MKSETAPEETLLSPALRQAIESETHMRTTRGFDAQFFATLEEKQARNRTWRGQLERLMELEVSGVAVWRLAGSGVAGGVLPTLVLGYCLAAPPQNHVPSLPQPLLALTPFYLRKFWEEETWKNPYRSARIALLDPHFNSKSYFGGTACA